MALNQPRRYRRASNVNMEATKARLNALDNLPIGSKAATLFERTPEYEDSPTYIVDLDEEQRQAEDSFGKDRTAEEIKREIVMIRSRLEVIEKLKTLEKPFKARLKTLERCLTDLEKVRTLLVTDIEVVSNELPPSLPEREIELTPDEIDSPVNNLKDFK